MSVCLESTSNSVVLPAQVDKLAAECSKNDSEGASVTTITAAAPKSTGAPVVASTIIKAPTKLQADVQAKINTNPSVITVVNTPITVVKSIGGANTTFALNSLANAGSQSTITLMNAAPPAAKSELVNNGSLSVAAPVNEKQQSAIHNVLVKQSAPAEGAGISVPDMPQSHKLLTANSFPPTNILQKMSPVSANKTVNGKRPTGKVKVVSQLVNQSEQHATAQPQTANPGPSNVILNKNQRLFQQHPKVVGNGATKYLTKHQPDSPATAAKRIVYPMQQSNITLKCGGYKAAPPPPALDAKTHQLQQATSRALKTMPPQRPAAMPNKPNYIGKHAVQAQKLKPRVKPKIVPQSHLATISTRPMPTTVPVGDHSAQTIFNQALTAQILETLTDKESKPMVSSTFGSLNIPKTDLTIQPILTHREREVEARDYKSRSLSLDTLSRVCQAVLLDHNYNATLPSEPPKSPAQAAPSQITSSPLNGAQHQHPHQQFSPVTNYHQPNTKRARTSSQSAVILPQQPQQHQQQHQHQVQREDDAGSDISDSPKIDTEGEETDTAPEAEAVANEANDRYGDYVTRCICGFIHDDGFMIECDKCKVWQHVRCVVKTKKVPEDYSCEECEPRSVDRQKARALQQQWMREIQERDAKLRKEQMALSDSDSSDAEAHKNRRKDPPRRQRRESMSNRTRLAKRKERKVPTKRAAKAKPGKSDDEKLPQIRQWIENYEEAVTNHYSPELRARISSVRLNGAHSEIAGGVDPGVNKCRVQTNPTTNIKYLIASVSLPMGTPVIELRGKYMLSTQHRSTTRQQRPGPFLFFHTLVKDTEVCVDTRTYGNSARFVRRSCTPNAKLQHVLEKGAVHLYIVTTKSVEKGSELTIRHESHDIAVATLAELPCACINPEYCALIKGHRRHNGESAQQQQQQPPQTPQHEGRKRRGRQSRDTSISAITSPPIQPPAESTALQIVIEPEDKEVKVKLEEVEIKKEEVSFEADNESKPSEADVIETEEVKPEKCEIKEEPEEEPQVKTEVKEEENKDASRTSRNIPTRRVSRHSQENPESNSNDGDKKPMSREERKMAAIVKAIERLEKQEQRRQEHQAKQANRRESDPKQDDSSKSKRRKRKGRARTTSTNSRRNRLDSTESVHSSDDTLLSPPSEAASPTKAAGMLLALANGECRKSPDRLDSSNSSHSSPETPLSAACLMVAAAVEPLEPGFKFPKTKKGLMNEWLNKSDVVQPASAISPSSLTPHIESNNTLFAVSPTSTTPSAPSAKCANVLSQAAAAVATFCEQPKSGSAKKRWLRQAISEDQCDSPPQADAVAPPKKRKLPRESLSCESSPPTTPIANVSSPQVEIITHQEEDGITQLEPEATLHEMASEMRQEFGHCVELPQRVETPPPACVTAEEDAVETRIISIVSTLPVESAPITPTVTISSSVNSSTATISRAIMDPRLAPRISTSELVGTVEKTLSFLGYEEKKQPEAITPTKRKLSITEYRQRKKLNNNDKTATNADDMASITEESNSSQSPKLLRPRSYSSSSVTSASASDDEQNPQINTTPVEVKALSAFNSEPTELERQRESVSLRLKRALGLPVDSHPKNLTSLNVETILNTEIPLPTKTALASPNFPIPGSVEPIISTSSSADKSLSETEETCDSPPPPILQAECPVDTDEVSKEKSIMSEQPESDDDDDEDPSEAADADADAEEKMDIDVEPESDAMIPFEMEERKVLYYTPDDEESTENTSSYVPPFNNPLYPNTCYASYGSVIDDDAPYEGRNPSPPPDAGGKPS